MTQHSGENEPRCERDGCTGTDVLTYCRFGSTLSASPGGAVGFNSTSAGLQPEQPVTLCFDHALDAFGTAFRFGEQQC